MAEIFILVAIGAAVKVGVGIFTYFHGGQVKRYCAGIVKKEEDELVEGEERANNKTDASSVETDEKLTATAVGVPATRGEALMEDGILT